MNKVFVHIAKLGKYQLICDEIFTYIKNSGILNNAKLYLSIVGIGEIIIPIEHEVIYQNDNVRLGEFPILMKIRELSLETDEECNILYIHTKGASVPENECINDWRKYMLYFNVTKYKDCVSLLKNHDTCGVDLRKGPVLHYSGNFWWSKFSHIRKLPLISEMEVVLSERHKGEFWICSVDGDFYSVHDCGINQYERHLYRYEEKKYYKNYKFIR
jgi:hypothetical protein